MNAKPPMAAPRLASTIPGRAFRFEYTGRTALAVNSPITGRHYRFDHAGARVEADPRDRALLTGVPNLRQLR